MLLPLVLCCLNAVIAEKGTGEVVFVTGASSGIGYGLSKYLAAQGYKVVLTARRKSKLDAAVEGIKASGGEAIAISLDVTDEVATVDAIIAAEAKFGPINHFVLNAGVFIASPLDTAVLSNVQKQLDVNVMGVFTGMKHGIHALRRAKGRKTITIVSSVGGSMSRLSFAAMPTDSVPYVVTKAALDHLTRASVSLQKEGINVYGLKPACFRSEMVETIASGWSIKVDDIAGGNPFFAGICSDARNVGIAIEHFLDGSTKYGAGYNVVIDNDATFDAFEHYKDIEAPNEKSFFVGKSDLRGLDGGEYKCFSERTCDFFNKKEL